MALVSIVERDDVLRESLRDLLLEAGHDLTHEAATIEDALAYLACETRRTVVIVSNEHPSHRFPAAFFAVVVDDARLAVRHRYVLLTTSSSAIPIELVAYLTRLNVVVLSKPFNIDDVLDTVGTLAARLASVRARKRNTP